MIVSDLCLGLVACAAGTLWATGRGGLGLLVAVTLIFGTAESVYGPASAAFSRYLLAGDDLIRGKALAGACSGAALLLGTAVGGILIAAGEFAAVALVDGASFLVIGGGLATVRAQGHGTVGQKNAARFRQDTARVIGLVWSSPLLRWSTLRSLMLNCIGLATLNLGLVRRAQELGWSGRELACVEIGLAGGTIVSGVLMGRRVPPQRPALVASTMFVAACGALVGLMASTDLYLSIVLAGVFGAILIMAATLDNSLVQAHIPFTDLGGVNGILLTAVMAGMPAGYALMGYAAAQFGVGPATVSVAALPLGACALFLLVKALRNSLMPASARPPATPCGSETGRPGSTSVAVRPPPAGGRRAPPASSSPPSG